MKLVELLQNQEMIVQLAWDEQKIEFVSNVIDKDETSIYVTPYIHNGCELELNVGLDNNVICSIYADDPDTEQRISWKGVSLTTVKRGNKTVYCLNTHSYNAESNHDDRRLHERVEIQVEGYLSDGEDGEVSITIHDISDNGISFYVPGSYEPKSQQLSISFTDNIDKKIFDIQVTCAVSRVNKEDERTLVGCRVLEENNNYRIYELLKRLRKKNHKVIQNTENDNTNTEDKIEPKVA